MSYLVDLQAMYRVLPDHASQTIIISNVPLTDIPDYISKIQDLDVAHPFYIRSIRPL
jgi:hypothetical protein